MKLIHMRCPGCGSNLEIDLDGKQAFCQFCGAKLLIDDEVQRIEIENPQQAGYEFEKGRQKAREEAEKAERARQRAIKEAKEKRQRNYERHHQIAEEQKSARDAKYCLIGFGVFFALAFLISVTVEFMFAKVMLIIAVACFDMMITSAATQSEYHYSYTEQAEVDDDGEIIKIYDDGKQTK